MFKGRIRIRYVLMTGLLVATGVSMIMSYRAVSRSLGPVVYSEKKLNLIATERAFLKEVQGAQEVSFTTDDGLRIKGLLVLRKNAQRLYLIFHGYRGAKEMKAEFARTFPNDTILLFDFRAHGESEGNLITLGAHEVRDARAAVQFIKAHEQIKDLPLYGIGMSMGGAVLLQLAYQEPTVFKGIVIDSSFATLQDQLRVSFPVVTNLPRIPFMYLSEFMFWVRTGIKPYDIRPVDVIGNVQVPILIVHAEDDKITPVEQAHKLYARAREPKSLWLVESCKHATICRENMQEYAKRVEDFFKPIH